ncbi:hypothetical protein AVEN_44707-1 [Araneus ventricosus]|uniref:Uncharacterized protein n=1 Tax=Araneus ventricosus TaxID=182803 RepID=A0A4Y2UJA9_ARAVE|nr:hypothetical protein AVEN_44707-1 [Araneus ventricosus]
METLDCEVEDVSEYENHTRQESETSDYYDNILTQAVHNVQYIQSKLQNMNWSLDPPPRSSCLTSANFMGKKGSPREDEKGMGKKRCSNGLSLTRTPSKWRIDLT